MKLVEFSGVETTLDREFKSVHDAHCCRYHGCKYGDDDCPVVAGLEEGVACEQCTEYDLSAEKAVLDLYQRLFRAGGADGRITEEGFWSVVAASGLTKENVDEAIRTHYYPHPDAYY